jgi:hypothetical protein
MKQKKSNLRQTASYDVMRKRRREDGKKKKKKSEELGDHQL